MQLSEYFKLIQQRVDECLKKKLDSMPAEPATLKEAVSYALLLGGKRARPFLVYATGSAYGADMRSLDYVAAAIECIHAYSLVHDDMPEMDNDMLRRGEPSVHAKFGSATALLAGDTLQALAFELLTDSKCRLSGEVKGRMCACLAKAAGFEGMCGGQAIDLASEHCTLKQEELEKLHSLKTGALIACAVELGFIAGRYEAAFSHHSNDMIANALGIVEAPEVGHDLKHLTDYGRKVGLAFQVRDDVLDVTGDSKILGKNVGSDELLEKSTYVTLLGVEKADEYARSLCEDAITDLERISVDTDLLKQFARFCIERDH